MTDDDEAVDILTAYDTIELVREQFASGDERRILSDAYTVLQQYEEDIGDAQLRFDEEMAEEFADRLDPGNAMGRGVRRDELMESRMQAQEWEETWNRFYVRMDSMIDDPNEIPEPMANEIERMHEKALQFSRFFEFLADELSQREQSV